MSYCEYIYANKKLTQIQNGRHFEIGRHLHFQFVDFA